MNEDQIKDIIRQTFDGRDFARLWFILMELGHAWVNIPREALRSLGLPDAKEGKNWVDQLARGLAGISGLLVFVFVIGYPAQFVFAFLGRLFA